MNQTRNACLKSPAIAREWAKYGRLDVKPEKGFFTAKKSQQTLQKEESERKYTSRRNICGVCFEAKSLTGTCSCTD